MDSSEPWQPRPQQLPDRWRTTASLLTVTLAGWLIALTGQFHYDDLSNIVLDSATADPTALLERLGNGFRPLLRLSYALDFRLWGWAPAGFLATNLLLHLFTVLGVAALARHRLGSERAVVFAAAIFALQPAHAAAIAWASGRSTLLATALLVAALLSHERAAGDRRWRAVPLLSFALAVLTKEIALVFPLLLLIWEVTRSPAPSTRDVLRRIAPAILTAVGLAILALVASSRLREIIAYSLALAGPGDALATNAAALPSSLSLWFRPWALSIEQPATFSRGEMYIGAVVLCAMIAGALAALRARRPLLALALLWPIASLLPTHSVLARLDPITEKSLYLAWIGPSLALGAAATHAWAALPRQLHALSATALSLLLVSLCAWRASVWADPAALWSEATARMPQSPRAWSNRALAELDGRHPQAASQSIARALALAPADQRIHNAALAVWLASPPVEEEKP